MNQKQLRIGLFLFACLFPVDQPQAQVASDPWYGRQAKPKNMDPPLTFEGTFSIEFPKDWPLAPGHTGTIISSVERTRGGQTGGFITVEYWRLAERLEDADIPGARDRELSILKGSELSGKGFTSDIKKAPYGQVIAIRYTRPGLRGEDHVVQYSIPVGTTMYRLICIAPAKAIDRYRPIFAHVAASFSPLRLPGL